MIEADIAAQSGSVFSEMEIELVRDIVLDQTYDAVRSLMDELTLFDDGTLTPKIDSLQARRKLLRAWLSVFYDIFLDGTVAVKGGKEGDDYDNMRDKNELRGRVRRALGLPELVPYQQDPGYNSRHVTQSIFIKYVP